MREFLMSMLILAAILLLIFSVLIVSLAWIHHPGGIIKHYLHRKDGRR